MQKTITILVKGKVQGVWYRKHALEKATELGVTGTVENLKEGHVQLIASGTEAQLKELASWCQQGPPRALVEEVIIADHPFISFHDFRIIRHFL